MSGDVSALEKAVETLRQAFDRGFASPPADASQAFEDVLAIRLGGAPFALRLSEAAGLYADRRIVPFPSPVPEFLGLAGLRGQLVPVYHLGVILGQGAAAAPRWFVAARGANAIGLAFDVFEAHVRAPRSAFAADLSPATARGHVRGAVRIKGTALPLIDLASVVEAISQRAARQAAPKERSSHD